MRWARRIWTWYGFKVSNVTANDIFQYYWIKLNTKTKSYEYFLCFSLCDTKESPYFDIYGYIWMLMTNSMWMQCTNINIGYFFCPLFLFVRYYIQDINFNYTEKNAAREIPLCMDLKSYKNCRNILLECWKKQQQQQQKRVVHLFKCHIICIDNQCGWYKNWINLRIFCDFKVVKLYIIEFWCILFVCVCVYEFVLLSRHNDIEYNKIVLNHSWEKLQFIFHIHVMTCTLCSHVILICSIDPFYQYCLASAAISLDKIEFHSKIWMHTIQLRT